MKNMITNIVSRKAGRSRPLPFTCLSRIFGIVAVGATVALVTLGCPGDGGGNTALDAPTGLTATAGNVQVDLTWTAVTNATSYEVERATGAGSTAFARIAEDTTIDTPNHADTGLINGTVYRYRVRAVNANDMSGFSDVADATPSGTRLMSPTGLTATLATTDIMLSWTVVAGTNVQYVVIRSDGSSIAGATDITTITDGTLTYTDTGLTAGAYTYAVRARTGDDDTTISANSNVVSETVLPMFPTISSAVAIATRVTLIWDAVTGTNVQYVVLRAEGSDIAVATEIITTITDGALTYTDTTVTKGTEYSYAVQSRIGIVGASSSANSNVVIRTAETPAPRITAGIATATRVTLIWNAVTVAGENVQYVVIRATGDSIAGADAMEITVITDGALTYTSTGLTTGTQYQHAVQVRIGVDDATRSANSNVVDRTLQVPTPTAVAIWNSGTAQGDFGFTRCQNLLDTPPTSNANATLGAVERELKEQGYTKARFFGSTSTYDFTAIATDSDALDAPADAAVHAFRNSGNLDDGRAIRTTTFGSSNATVTIGNIANIRPGGEWLNANVTSVLNRIGISGNTRFWSFTLDRAYPPNESCIGASSSASASIGHVGNASSVDSGPNIGGSTPNECNSVRRVLCVAY